MGSLRGCCTQCLLLLAGWCEGFCGVRVSEALADYVVLVPLNARQDRGSVSLPLIGRDISSGAEFRPSLQSSFPILVDLFFFLVGVVTRSSARA